MKKKNKVYAFTLSEMIVVLILTSIVVGLAFSVLGLVQKHMKTIQQNFNQNIELKKIETALWLDFNRYATTEYIEDDAVLKFKSEIDSVQYKFTTEHIIKSVDTFHIPIHSKQFFFNGDLANEGVIDAMRLETTKAFQNQKLFIFKQKDATAFMN